MAKRRSTPYRPPDLNRDHARPRTAPAPPGPAVEARLTELASPVAFALGDEYRRLGLRARVLDRGGCCGRPRGRSARRPSACACAAGRPPSSTAC
jgi:hypothetical protein